MTQSHAEDYEYSCKRADIHFYTALVYMQALVHEMCASILYWPELAFHIEVPFICSICLPDFICEKRPNHFLCSLSIQMG